MIEGPVSILRFCVGPAGGDPICTNHHINIFQFKGKVGKIRVEIPCILLSPQLFSNNSGLIT